MREINVFVVKPLQRVGKVVTIDGDDYTAMYPLLDCACFDIPRRTVGGVEFDIFCDDEALYAEKVAVGLLYDDQRYNLVGNLVFTHSDDEGNTIGLTNDEIRMLYDHLFIGRQANLDEETVIVNGGDGE